jgi:aminopeptidase N
LKCLLFVLVCLACNLTGCAREDPARDSAAVHSPREPGDLLTRDEASARKRLLSELQYRLEIDLTRGSDGFAGVVDMSFNYAGGERPLTIDFRGGEVVAVTVAGKAIDYDYNGYFITLPGASLEAGSQRLRVEYTHDYSKDGSGLYRYEDPQDGRIYLYTNFEPYDANRLFPHFDQPDLKARYSLTVRAPTGWQVVSASRESAVADAGEIQVWSFPPTEPLSSYVFSLHAGEYAVIESTEFRYPLRLFLRQSMVDYAEPEFWFEITRQGFDFFDTYFALPYPFRKYDQLIVPDFNSGAMENVAAVTFSESRLHRGEITRQQRMDLARVILHEMAHMWFGNITTMAWWNGLWLNESFATILSELALVGATGFEEGWHDFFASRKQNAYWSDQLVTTHPIELPVADTDEATVNFDGITYGKGASVLKQLIFLLGDPVFRQGVRDYLAANAWDNTELEDFTGALANAADRSLDDWTRRWLYTAGLNTIQVDYRCQAGRVSAMSLLQTAPEEHPFLREQRTRIALYRLKGEALELAQAVPVQFEGARTQVHDVVGSACPDYVYPNHADHAYIKVALDDRSLATISEHIGGLRDPMQRSMAWYDLFSMVLDAKLDLTDYLDILAAKLASETDLTTASDLMGNLRASFSYLHQLPEGEALLEATAERFEALLWQQLEVTAGDARQLWFGAYVDTASNVAAWSRLAELLAGDILLDGFQLDQDQRWRIVLKLSEHQWPGHAQLARAEARRDHSSIGKSNALRAEVLAARGEAKYRWMQTAITEDENYTLRRSRDIAGSLFPYSSQRRLAEPYAVEMLAQLPRLNDQHDIVFHHRVTRLLVPRLCTAENVERLKTAAQRYSDLSPTIVRGLKVAAQQDERCVNIGLRLAAAGRAG